ncbi:hypothetical protein CO058_03040 [candidate division WWE3 bacterium CG_4_9_14_0_2_um_filter_35_11]|uniref:Baseplate protein J-like domain-containing protein n=1 Tax=candidate division WWE3 bacterium CG_4_9_14_0_2_um_filter_35_11 TaxID=1975077 RepID=A0A2M8ELF5_UNCKA|nr:MAG: hypothetical protein COV25_01970 [candidate division WWE3 bacterium CG10_big_fil_rev_8_21_14_0_10_35_32]PJC23558.1 MAG: hypothetical protein CO058_03040 [candidate division WWE3 bacterium CG_4_9_14_0_2_um_filter_35_11]
MNYNFTADEKTEMNDLISAVEDAKEADIKILFKKRSSIYLKSLNLRILQKLASEKNKTVTFDVENQSHKDYIDAVNGDFMESADDAVDLNMNTKMESVNKTSLIAKLFNMRKKFDTSDDSKSKKKGVKILIYIFVFLFIFVGGVFALWWYMPSASVKITVDSQILVKILDVKADPSATEVSIENSTIPAINVDVTVTESQTIPTTGKKEVGDNAKGKITFYNKTNDVITLKKGTIVKFISTDKESLKYETQENIDVSAQVTTENPPNSSTTEYGSKEANVKAVSFGEKYNQDSGEKFDVDGYDTDKLIAENKDKLDGGTLKELNVVTQADMDGLKRALDEFIKTKVVEALNKKVVSSQIFPESSAEFTTISGVFDKKLDEEGDELTLTMATKGVGIVYDQSILDQIVSELIKTVVPSEYSLDSGKPEYEVATTKAKAGTGIVDLQIKLRSYITPNLDEKKMISDMVGMKLDQAQSYLNSISSIKGFEISLSPQMPPILQTMPHISKNIEIIIDKK